MTELASYPPEYYQNMYSPESHSSNSSISYDYSDSPMFCSEETPIPDNYTAPVNESLICEAPHQDYYSTPASETPLTSTQSNLSFIEEESLMCEAPAISHIDSDKFTASLDNSKLVTKLSIELEDQNGFQHRGQNDIDGEIVFGTVGINQEIFAEPLKNLKGFTQINSATNTTTEIKDVGFNHEEQAYIIDLEVEKKFWKIPVWDNFKIKLKVDNEGKLVAQLDDNWFPDDKILNVLEKTISDKIKSKIPEGYRHLNFSLKQNEDKLVFEPSIQDLKIPIGNEGSINIEEIDAEKAKFHIDPQGHLHMDVTNLEFTASSNPEGPKVNPTDVSDHLDVDLRLGVGKDNSIQAYSQGQLNIDLDSNETQAVKMGNESLENYFNSGQIESDFSMFTTRKPGEKPEVLSHQHVSIKNAQIGSQQVDLETSLKLEFNEENGFSLIPESAENYQALQLSPEKSGVELLIDGSNYFKEMKTLINDAEESIHLETFEFKNDAIGQEVAYLLAQKAAGLSPDSPINSSTISDGVDVKFIFNSKHGKAEEGKSSHEALLLAKEKVFFDIQKSPLSSQEKDILFNQLEEKFKWLHFHEDIVRSDHRKVMVVDGSRATVGGMNIGEKYLSENSYHDVMLKVGGPQVRDVQKEFLENWFEFNQLPMPSDAHWSHLLKSTTELQQDLLQRQENGEFKQTAQIDVLVTDDHQSDIEQGILQVIDNAQREIKIEQAFFSYGKITDQLKEALKRNVDVHLVLAEDSVVSMFDQANLASVYELVKAKKAGAPGQVYLHYYNGKQGHENDHIHTKAITADGQYGIIGSANMIGRSLKSPFTQIDEFGDKRQALYNKELSLYIEEPEFIEEVNQRLFQYDIIHQSRELDLEAIEKEVEKAGGEDELKKKALIATVT